MDDEKLVAKNNINEIEIHLDLKMTEMKAKNK